MGKFICIHGHFYQPPRENPWLESVELQDSAAPYHDWNERVTYECYAPNARARLLDGEGRIERIVSNYSRISFNFGPTLLSWMKEMMPDIHDAIVEADNQSREHFSGHGSALAQCYNHLIMPLANRRDKYTQAVWGIRDFKFRFGREPEGMWLPETAADNESLEVLAELGIRFTTLVACLPVYRTYLRPGDEKPAGNDAEYLRHAVTEARQHRPDLSAELFELFDNLLSLKLRGDQETEFVMRFQQLTGGATAKGVEDTAFYCFNRFSSLNEVGGDPAQFSRSPQAFYKFCDVRQAHWPASMLTTSTHDTKRSEDVRARLNVLSEIPAQWIETVRRWSAMNECHRTGDFPDRNIEYLFYQTLAGAWPLTLDRIQAFMEKAACEAGQHTSWKRRDARYDEALKKFVAETLNNADLIADLEQFLKPVVEAGYVNSLAQTLLKLTAPGVPDIYQGCELWDFSLVDPDNRRPVDFEHRQYLLAETKNLSASEAWHRREEGLPKLWLIRRTLSLRKQWPEAFAGKYQPLSARGTKAEHVVTFLRGEEMITVVPRLTLGLKDWNGTVLELPTGTWRNELTGETVTKTATPIASLLRQFPVALLSRTEE